jgi:hypothetical protein
MDQFSPYQSIRPNKPLLEWITLLATVCADGTALPPGFIYAGASWPLYDR